MFATRVVLVLSNLMRSTPIPKAAEATCTILVLRPWPISTPPVLTPTLPSWYTCTSARAWFIGVLVKEIPKQIGMIAMPFLCVSLFTLNASISACCLSKSKVFSASSHASFAKTWSAI